VVVDDAAVQLAVLRFAPPAHALPAIVDDEVDEFAVLAAAHIQPAPGALEVARMGASADRFLRLGLGDKQLQAPDPDVRRGGLDEQAAVDAGPLAGSGLDVNGLPLRPDQPHLELLRRPAPVRPSPEEDRVAGLDRTVPAQRRGNVPGGVLRALA